MAGSADTWAMRWTAARCNCGHISGPWPGQKLIFWAARLHKKPGHTPTWNMASTDEGRRACAARIDGEDGAA